MIWKYPDFAYPRAGRGVGTYPDFAKACQEVTTKNPPSTPPPQH